jgi:hypothetical protein
MSDTSQGHGWWLASDGKWYPPEAWTGPPQQLSQPPFQTDPSGNPSGQPPSYPVGQVAYPSSQPPSPYAYGGAIPPATAWRQPRPTNGLAVASLVCSCVGIVPFLFGLPCVLGIIFGFVSRNRIKRSNGTLGGDGLALAGIIVGFSLIGIFIIAVILIAALGGFHSCVSTGSLRSNCSN